jgi:hypothetical protein
LLGLLIWSKSSKRAWLNVAAVASVINAIIAYGAFKDYWGPRLMRLPDHHCLYCLLQYQPVSIVILGFFILGTFCALWPLWLRHTSADAAKERLASLNLILFKWAAVCLLASWAILRIKII